MRLILVFTFFLIGFTGFTQVYFSPIQTITQNNEKGYARPRVEALNGDGVYILWGDKTKDKMHGARYENDQWSINELNPSGLNVFTADWAGPEMASNGNNILVSFKALPENKEFIYSILSQDGGKNFQSEVRIDSNVWTRFPAPAFDPSNNAYVAFMEFDSAFLDPHYAVSYSSDGGNSYGPGTPASVFAQGEACDCCPAHVLGDQNDVHLFFRNNDNNLRDMWVVKSENNGSSFDKGADIDLNNWMINSCPSTGPDALDRGDSIIVVWMSAGSGASRINYAMVEKANLIVSGSGEVSSTAPASSNQNYPRISGSGDTIGVVWQESGGGKIQILAKFSQNGLSGLGSAPIDTISEGTALIQGNPDIDYRSGIFHIVWQNNIDRSIHYRKASLNSWLKVKAIDHSEGFGIHPNPANNNMKLLIPEFMLGCQYNIYGSDGKILSSGTLTSIETDLDVSKLSRGAYVLSVTKESRSMNKTFLIE